MNAQIQINAAPHPGQSAVHRHPARFKVVDAGRRWGKTRLGVMECLDVASKGGRAWWVAPSYKTSEMGWRPLRKLGARVGAEVRIVDRMINLPSGGSVVVRSADDPDSLRGEGLDFAVLDECPLIQERAWTEALRPALADRQGKALFIGTPKGRNFFWRLFQQGQQGGTEWMSWQFPTSSNPYIAPAEIEAARRGLPERVFLQEFMAEFVGDANGLFRRVTDAATATEQQEAQAGHQYVFGIDWGKHEDSTAIAVLDTTDKALVGLDHFSRIDYTVQMGRLQALYERFWPRMVIAERNAMGEPLIEQLLRAGMPVEPWLTTNASKAQAVDALALAFERGEIRILPDPTLINELQAYEAERLPSGMLRYSAPSGMHDDTVIALMLAWQGVTDYAGAELGVAELRYGR